MLTLANANAPNDSAADNQPSSLPHNIEVEQALLGALLINNEAFFRVADFLSADHFFDPVHQTIFLNAEKLIRAGKVATPITLRAYVAETVTGDFDVAKYLALLAAEATAIINTEDYGLTLYELALRRQLIELGHEVSEEAKVLVAGENARPLIEKTEARLYQLAETGRTDTGFQGFDKALAESISMTTRAYERDGGLSGHATGLVDLDGRMGGMQPSDLIILAGRPGMGKTALATNIAFNLAKSWRGHKNDQGQMVTHEGGIVGFFSLEMSVEQLATRILSEQVRIASSSLRRGRINDQDFKRIHDIATEIRSLPLYIDDTGGLSIAQIASRARRLKRQKGLDVLFIDYLQLLSGSGRNNSGNRVQEITEISTGLKALAKELNVPVVALSQLSRAVESRDDKRPILSDLRESGSIEQDADVVMFVYREEYYLNNQMPPEGSDEHMSWLTKMEKVHGKAEVIVAKQRHGPTGTVNLQFEAMYTRFSNLVRAQDVPET